MNYINTEKDSVLMGSGYLYAIESNKFDTENIDVSAMAEIGYISESATFTRTHDAKEINSANYGLIELVNGNYTTTFDTGIISYKAEADKIPSVALVFVGEDEDTGNSFKLVMPKCKWVGDYELDFNNDNPVELNYNFRCLNVTMPNGKVGAAWLEETAGTTNG